MQSAQGIPGTLPGARLLHREPREFRVTVHEFKRAEAVDWGESFGEDEIVLCLNLSGQGTVGEGPGALRLEARTVGFFFTGDGIAASREGEEGHSFVTLAWSRAAFLDLLKGAQDQLSGKLRSWLAPRARAGTAGAEPMTPRAEAACHDLRQPPVAEAAVALWYQGKALELLSTLAFADAPDAAAAKGQEMFCSRQKRVAQERVERTVRALQQNLAEPPDLETLGAQAGCSPFYLSRLFSKEMQLTIPQYIREQRMQRAAELLRTGRYNVTEAALEVGYNSLSHFSKAFWEKFGCCPGLYPQGAKLFTKPTRAR